MSRTVLAVSNHAEVVGGGEISFLALLQGLDRSRWQPVVAVPGEGRVATACRALGLSTHVIPLPTLRSLGPSAVCSVAALRRLTGQTRASVLHANGSRAMAYAGVAGRLARRPVVWHVRVAEPEGLFDRALGGLASAIVVNSRAVGRRFAWAPAGKVRCIYNGIDLVRFRPGPPAPGLRAALGLPDGREVVGSAGRFVPYKGYASLLEAVPLVRQARPGVHWLLVGDGEQRGMLEARATALGVAGEVHFVGWRDDVPDVFALCDLVVLPSLGEHFGRVLIEAMAMARPVVATDAGGVPEVVRHGETGLLVPPGDPKALAEAVLALLADPERRARLGSAGRRDVEARFGLARHAAAVEALYRELARPDDGDV
jgi:glycosyltransferase involved in cell wall biosynthesis